MMIANIAAEKAILGAALLRREWWDDAARTVRAEDFSLDSHRRIFRHMAALAEGGGTVDIVTLVSELDRKKELAMVGDVDYVTSLIDGVPDSASSVSSYIKLVKQWAQTRALIAAARRAIARAEAGESPATITGGLIESWLDVEEQGHGPHEFTLRQVMSEVLAELQTQATAGGVVGLPTGIAPLDDLTGGLRKAELIVIGALPGAGKTALAVQIIAANALAEVPVGVFSLEMSRWDLGKRFLSAVTPVIASKIRHPRFVSEDEWRTLAKGTAQLSGWLVYVDDAGSLSVTELLSRARLFIRRHGVRLIVVDYLQLVRAEARDIRERVSKVADALRQLAKAEQVPVVLLSQLRRPQSVNDAPTLIDLKESGDIEARPRCVLVARSDWARR